MKKLLLILSALLIVAGTSTNCSRRAFSQQQGLMLTNKYNQPTNKKKSKKAKKKYKQRNKAYKKIRR